MSLSDPTQLKASPWIDTDRQSAPTLTPFFVVAGRSGGAYHGFLGAYGEDVKMVSRFMFNAATGKAPTDQGRRPASGRSGQNLSRYGQVAKLAAFRRAMESLGVAVMTHMPVG